MSGMPCIGLVCADAFAMVPGVMATKKNNDVNAIFLMLVTLCWSPSMPASFNSQILKLCFCRFLSIERFFGRDTRWARARHSDTNLDRSGESCFQSWG